MEKLELEVDYKRNTTMTIQELERQLLTLDRNEQIRLIQVMVRSLAIPS